MQETNVIFTLQSTRNRSTETFKSPLTKLPSIFSTTMLIVTIYIPVQLITHKYGLSARLAITRSTLKWPSHVFSGGCFFFVRGIFLSLTPPLSPPHIHHLYSHSSWPRRTTSLHITAPDRAALENENVGHGRNNERPVCHPFPFSILFPSPYFFHPLRIRNVLAPTYKLYQNEGDRAWH